MGRLRPAHRHPGGWQDSRAGSDPQRGGRARTGRDERDVPRRKRAPCRHRRGRGNRRRCRARPRAARAPRHARRAWRAHIRHDRPAPRPPAQRGQICGEGPGVGRRVHRGEPDPSPDRARFVRAQRRAVRGDHRGGRGVRAALLRVLSRLGHTGAPGHTRGGAAPRAQPQPRVALRGAGPGRHDGRDAPAAPLLRHGETERGDDQAVHRGRRDDDRAGPERPLRHGRLGAGPHERPALRYRRGPRRERGRTLGRKDRPHGRRRRPDPALTGDPGRGPRPLLQHGGQPPPRLRRRGHRVASARAVGHRHQLLGD